MASFTNSGSTNFFVAASVLLFLDVGRMDQVSFEPYVIGIGVLEGGGVRVGVEGIGRPTVFFLKSPSVSLQKNSLVIVLTPPAGSVTIGGSLASQDKLRFLAPLYPLPSLVRNWD